MTGHLNDLHLLYFGDKNRNERKEEEYGKGHCAGHQASIGVLMKREQGPGGWHELQLLIRPFSFKQSVGIFMYIKCLSKDKGVGQKEKNNGAVPINFPINDELDPFHH